MKYDLKDKLIIDKEFLSDLEEKSWSEIEHLQNQIANIEDNLENKALIQLFKNLLASYYDFTGGLENLSDIHYIKDKVKIENTNDEISPVDEPIIEPDVEEPIIEVPEDTTDFGEPFEYFVDFDEPIGDPLTDDDLYNN